MEFFAFLYGIDAIDEIYESIQNHAAFGRFYNNELNNK